MKTEIQDLDVTIINDTIVADFFLVEGDVETHNYLQLQKHLIVEHIVDGYLNVCTTQMQDGSLEDTFLDPESMLMDDPKYCVQSYLEEIFSC